MNDEKFLTVSEVANILRIRKIEVYNLINQEKLKVIKTNRVLIKQQELETFINNNHVGIYRCGQVV